MKEWQVEFKIKGESGVYPYIVSAMTKEWAEQDAIQMLLRDFPIFNGREIYKYKIIDLTKRRITNYENIRNMNIEEFANFLSQVISFGFDRGWNDNIDKHFIYTLEWLKSEIEE